MFLDFTTYELNLMLTYHLQIGKEAFYLGRCDGLLITCCPFLLVYVRPLWKI